VLLISAVIFGVIYAIFLSKGIDEKDQELISKIFMNFTVWGTLIIFMWIMSLLNLWR